MESLSLGSAAQHDLSLGSAAKHGLNAKYLATKVMSLVQVPTLRRLDLAPCFD